MLNDQLPGFKAVRRQLAINILHNHMCTMVIFIVLKNYNKILQKIAVHATMRERWKVLFRIFIFKFLYTF